MIRVILVVLVVLAADAGADTSARARADATTAYADGQRRYLAEDYEGAAKQFLVAYNLDPDPAYLFNVAQAHRFAKQCARSAKYYRRFLAVARNPPNKADVARYIAEQDACAKTQPPPGPEAEPDPKPKGDPKPDPEPTKIEPVKRDPEPPAKSDPGQFRKRLALASFAVGAIGVGVGAVFGLRIESTEKARDAFIATCEISPCENYETDKAVFDDRAASAKTLMITSFAAAGVAIGAGVFLYVTGKRRSEHVALTPARRGAVVSFTFSH